MEVMQVTYQKRDGSIIQRLRNTSLPYKIGEITSMGWKVLNVEYEYNNKYYSELEYHTLIHNNTKRNIKKKQNVEMCINEFKKFIYYFIAAEILNFIRVLLGS